MWSSTVTRRLSKQLATTQLLLKNTAPALSGNNLVAPMAATTASEVWTIPTRSFAGNRKTLDAKNVKRLKIQAKKKKNVSKPAKSMEDKEDLADKDDDQPFLQHQEWTKFQQSISVDGFQTGQVTTAAVLKKGRGGKQVRRRKEKELARLEQSNLAVGTDEKFPAIRYSQEETERLLEQAYGALPKRSGKRGTRNLQRQENRWQLVRNIRAKYKAQIAAAHERRMEKRHWKRQQVIAAKELAPTLRAQDLDYQAQVLQRWADTMHGTTAEEEEEGQEDDIVLVQEQNMEKVVSARE
ncbi:MAG: hypothetical protein SGBAC_012808 [Bacillariaceae sp.]